MTIFNYMYFKAIAVMAAQKFYQPCKIDTVALQNSYSVSHKPIHSISALLLHRAKPRQQRNYSDSAQTRNRCSSIYFLNVTTPISFIQWYFCHIFIKNQSILIGIFAILL